MIIFSISRRSPDSHDELLQQVFFIFYFEVSTTRCQKLKFPTAHFSYLFLSCTLYFHIGLHTSRHGLLHRRPHDSRNRRLLARVKLYWCISRYLYSTSYLKKNRLLYLFILLFILSFYTSIGSCTIMTSSYLIESNYVFSIHL